jgi:hypothetical protein
MANEVSETFRYTARKNGAAITFSSSGTITMTGNGLLNATQSIGTTAETVSFGGISGVPGEVVIKNLDSVNFLELGGDSGLTVFKTKLLPGRSTVFQPTSATLYAKANTAAVRIQVLANEI